ncbi:MAG: RNA-processing protein [Candidatus Aenigmatarchaeota archaeon]
MREILETVIVPLDRIKVIKDRPVNHKIENTLNVKIEFQDNLVEIKGEGIELLQAKCIVKAIAKGFVPKKAFRLFDEEEVLEIIELEGFKDNKLKLIKSRLIGTRGKTRIIIEKDSGCFMSVCGKTVSLIGKYQQLEIARDAVNMILRGSKHSKVYGFLQKVRND